MLPRLFTRCVLIIGCVCFSSLALSNPLTYITYPDGVGITGCVDSSCPSEIIVPEMIDWKDRNQNRRGRILPMVSRQLYINPGFSNTSQYN